MASVSGLRWTALCASISAEEVWPLTLNDIGVVSAFVSVQEA